MTFIKRRVTTPDKSPIRRRREKSRQNERRLCHTDMLCISMENPEKPRAKAMRGRAMLVGRVERWRTAAVGSKKRMAAVKREGDRGRRERALATVPKRVR